MEERRRRKRMNTVTTGYNLAVWLVEIVAQIILLLPTVGVALAKHIASQLRIVSLFYQLVSEPDVPLILITPYS